MPKKSKPAPRPPKKGSGDNSPKDSLRRVLREENKRQKEQIEKEWKWGD